MTPTAPPPPSTDTPPPSDGSLVRAVRQGDQAAAAELFGRYAARVKALAGARCGGGYAVRFDADDIVQSVFRTFFHGIQQTAYQVPPDGELWGLLLVLALNKIRSQVDHHRAAKRSVHRTQAADASLQPLPAGPSADFLQVVLDDLLDGLPDTNAAVVRLRMEGYEIKEIAARTGRSRRTVERVLTDFRARLGEGE